MSDGTDAKEAEVLQFNEAKSEMMMAIESNFSV